MQIITFYEFQSNGESCNSVRIIHTVNQCNASAYDVRRPLWRPLYRNLQFYSIYSPHIRVDTGVSLTCVPAILSVLLTYNQGYACIISGYSIIYRKENRSGCVYANDWYHRLKYDRCLRNQK